MSDSDLMQLYSRRILALASDIPHLGKLENATGSAHRRSPQCGSSVTAHVVMDGDNVAEFSQEVRACALGQASASVLGSAVIGASREVIAQATEELEAMLKSGGPAPSEPFAALETLLPAREFPNRHASILLAWQATLGAIDAAQNPA
ncbi:MULTISPECIES: iron-sulfur cluster assembly scaffold protein [Paracoccus]|uniref:Iron-sulfur cluster assembly scaffold protein n=1 Tax=Paracoccus litorisediminis TaxID=2006130 RepID=A0A844HHE5_9RHOB|nr:MULTISPECIES: iron-sulfur cluster assembly scaffold protein [Paracoccus]MBD9525296.1 iron-sulfur cluster assembly scaffold protein [Paracoccus sp. PAR01]MTH57727.1 iron-sulfur cluster assembly scaffold protein [Paracoccus litorisediminis]